jgi:hypothetical protein
VAFVVAHGNQGQTQPAHVILAADLGHADIEGVAHFLLHAVRYPPLVLQRGIAVQAKLNAQYAYEHHLSSSASLVSGLISSSVR